MTDLSNKSTGKNVFRPLLIAFLVGASFFLSVLFLLSREASSQKLYGKAPVIKAPGIEGSASGIQPGTLSVRVPLRPDEVKPKVSRYDFRLTGSDTFYRIMSVLDVPGAEIQAVVKNALPICDLRQLKQDSVLRVFTVDGKLDRIEYKFNDFSLLHVGRDGSVDGGFKAIKSELPHELKTVFVSGKIENSLYEDGVKAGADPQTLMALSDIFAWDVDFASDIRKGDTFSIITEVLYVEGQPVRAGRVRGAEMVNDGRKYTAIYFEGSEGGGYYDSEGRSLRRTLLKSPLRFSRITSYFTNRRFHPILKTFRPHHGIDYGAPTGTPVESSGSGKVTFAGWKNGYGNFIEIKHNNSYSTAYGHLSRIKKGIRPGAKISQGDVIGYVGSTGISTGPHLHYEVRLGGNLINPLSIKAVADSSITSREKEQFSIIRDEIAKKLSGAETSAASNSAPPPAVRAPEAESTASPLAPDKALARKN